MSTISIAFMVSCLCLSMVNAENEQWKEFKLKFGKNYSINQEQSRLKVFQDNLAQIKAHNLKHEKGEVTFTMGVTQFSDMTNEEYRKLLTATNKPNTTTKVEYLEIPHAASETTLPDEVDWRTKNAVTPVKDQGTCGSCWSFSATGTLEGQNAIVNGQLISLSEQQLIDCCGSTYGNYGCQGGNTFAAYACIYDKEGIELESDYPYQMKNGVCKFDSSKVKVTLWGFARITQGNETLLQDAVANAGPVSVSIDASLNSFQHYTSGVYYDQSCSSTSLDHAVLAVGYGQENGNDYWLVKNSWGTTWGLEGYIKMARGRDNNCGIATLAVYPFIY